MDVRLSMCTSIVIQIKVPFLQKGVFLANNTCNDNFLISYLRKHFFHLVTRCLEWILWNVFKML